MLLNVGYVVASAWQDRTSWSTTAVRMGAALENESTRVEVIGPLQEPFRTRGRTKRHIYRAFGKSYQHYRDTRVARRYATQVSNQLRRSSASVVLSLGAIPVAYLETDLPIVFWADATFASLVGYYPGYESLARASLEGGYAMDRAALDRAAAVIFASEWAAQSARETYDLDPSRVHVIPYGANLEGPSDPAGVRKAIENRPREECELLFVGVDWQRKGGETALKVAECLNDRGLPTRLTLVGGQPDGTGRPPPNVHIEGFISKATHEGRERLRTLFARSHFLLLPTAAETFGIVLAEASSHAVPSLATDTGGIPTVIRPGRNGALFPLGDVDGYCAYIERLFDHYDDEYIGLAERSFFEAVERLNWSVSGAAARRVLQAVSLDARLP